MDLELLRTFLELNRSRHFGRTAEALHLTQAAVSSRLKSLEQQLGVVLFERSRREMRLTPEGGRLVRHAQRQIAAWRAARQDVALATATEQLVIGGSLRIWDALLQRWLHELRRNHPAMAIIAESQPPDILTRRLLDGTLDVAIMLEPAQVNVIQIKPIADIHLVLVSSSDGLNVSEALQRNYVHVDWGLSFGLDYRREYPDAPEAMTRVSHAKMALEYMTTLGGSAYLPRRMVANDLRAGRLHLVRGATEFQRQAWAAFALRSPRMALIETCLGLVDRQ